MQCIQLTDGEEGGLLSSSPSPEDPMTWGSASETVCDLAAQILATTGDRTILAELQRWTRAELEDQVREFPGDNADACRGLALAELEPEAFDIAVESAWVARGAA